MQKNKTGKPSMAAGRPAGRTGRYLKYAIGEIVLVVIGILIALSINNWNESIKSRSQELVLLKNLKLEMEENLTLIDDYLKTKEVGIAAADKLLTFTSPDYIEKREDSLAREFGRILGIDDYKAEIMVLNAAQSSNSLKLIRNQELKTNLAKWEQSLKRLLELVVYGNEHFSNSLIPIISDYYPLKSFPYDSGYGNFQEPSKHKRELEKMFRSREFENSLFRVRNFDRLRAQQAKEFKEYTLELLQMLNKELNM
jgi:hypothetical protein